MKYVFDLGMYQYLVYGVILAVVQIPILYYIDGKGSFSSPITSMLFGWHYIPEVLSCFLLSFFLQRCISYNVSKKVVSEKVGKAILRMSVGAIIVFELALFFLYYRESLFVLPIFVVLPVSYILGLVFGKWYE